MEDIGHKLYQERLTDSLGESNDGVIQSLDQLAQGLFEMDVVGYYCSNDHLTDISIRYYLKIDQQSLNYKDVGVDDECNFHYYFKTKSYQINSKNNRHYPLDHFFDRLHKVAQDIDQELAVVYIETNEDTL